MSACNSDRAGSPADFHELNQSCVCLPIDRSDADRKITNSNPIPGLSALLKGRPHLIAGTSVFLSDEDLSSIYVQIEALEAAAKSCAFRTILNSAATTHLVDMQPQTLGVMMGYDFHITPSGPKLIEVNTNAGGAFLVAALQESVGHASADIQKTLTATFISEWRRGRSSLQPRSIAIVDSHPQNEYLYPDMLLAQQWFEIAGIETVIVDPSELELVAGRLMFGNQVIDMVYNRLTDFMLQSSESAVIRRALETDAAIVSPAPRHHSLHANKRNLTILSDLAQVERLPLPSHHTAALSQLPKTELVVPENADALWKNRKTLFFKPASGFAGRAAYRGSKLTRKVWADILKGDYVAQEFVDPTYRIVEVEGEQTRLKYDVRVYTYDGTPLLLAARVYQGQTTNFRSPGGGFAPVITANASCC